MNSILRQAWSNEALDHRDEAATNRMEKSQSTRVSSQGYSEREITERLQPLAVCTVHRDLVYLRQQAKENLQQHIHETVPVEYQKCCLQINQVLKNAWEIVDKTADEKTRLQVFGAH